MYKSKICRVCGKEFQPRSSRQLDCNCEITKICVICGKEFIGRCSINDLSKTCSPDCLKLYTSQKQEESYLSTSRTCKWCGEVFTPEVKGQLYCRRPHFRSCEVCGKQFQLPEIIKNVNDLPRTCSKECAIQLRFQNGNPFQNVESRKKAEETYKTKTGYEHPAQNPKVLDRMKATTKERYGVEYFAQSEEYKSIYQDKMQAKFEKQAYSQTTEWKSEHVSDPSKLAEWELFLSDPITYIESHFETAPTYAKLSSIFGVQASTINTWAHRLNITDKIKYCVSSIEDEVCDLLKELYPTLTMIRHERKLIAPYELDIYIPQFQLAIEIDPTATHNSSISDPWGSEPKHYKYHQMKTELCEKQGIFLFHIFGYEWTHKREVILSMLRNLLQLNEYRIFARKTEIREVSLADATEFLILNHRQGHTVTHINLGLYYNNELVSLMTFCKQRHTIGPKSESDCYELVRFCNKANVSVVGGASKLFKHFISQYNPKYIISFSDRAHTRGKLYQTLGFKEVRRSDPGYVWVNVNTDKAYHRVNAQKRNIKRFLHDDKLDLTQTETQIMIAHRFVQVFDSGTITWKWTNDAKTLAIK